MSNPTRPRTSRKGIGRRANGEGTTYVEYPKGPDGPRRYRTRWKAPDGKHYSKVGRTKREALDKMAAVRASYDQGTGKGHDEVLATTLARWLGSRTKRARAGKLTDGTLEGDEHWVALLTARIGHAKLAELQPEHVEELLEDLGARFSRATIKIIRSKLNQALDMAVSRGYVARNVSRLAFPELPEAPEERDALYTDDIAPLLDALRGTRIEAPIVTGLFCGLSPGELLGLCWDMVDLDARLLKVRRLLRDERSAKGRARRYVLHEDVKLGIDRRRRDLEIPPVVAEALRAWRQTQRADRLRAGPEWQEFSAHGLVFTNPDGSPLNQGQLRWRLNALQRRAGLRVMSVNESTRHSTASFLLAAGLSPHQVAEVLGHSSTKMLERHYGHNRKPAVNTHISALSALTAETDEAAS